MKRILIVGGGITGLAAAHHLGELAAAREMPVEVSILERGTRAGGPLKTIRRDGFVIEAGADSFLTEKPAAAELARRIGLATELIPTRPEFRRTYVVRAGRLVEIPEGFSLLAPSRFMSVLGSPLFSTAGKLRIALEPLIPRRADSGDESLASFVTPRFVEMERKYGSVIRGLRAAEKARAAQSSGTSGARWNLFLSFRRGMGSLVEALQSRVGSSLRFGAEVSGIERRADSGWTVALASGERMAADAVICAAPAFAAARIVRAINPGLAELLGTITYASAAVVNMAFRIEDFPAPPNAFGFVVPIAENRKIIAGSFSSLKYQGRAPEGALLARAFLGGVLQKGMMELGDDEMIAAARDEFADLLGVTAAPAIAEVQRWPDAMPQYDVGHMDRIGAIERAAAEIPHFALAGAAYRGVGIPDCVRSGEEAARAIFDRIAAVR